MKSAPGAFGLVLFLTFLPLSAAAETGTREFTCPVDDQKFTSTVVTATNKAGGLDSDLCSYERGTQALPFEVHTCPSCGFSAVTKEFEQGFAADLGKKISEALAKWKEANHVAEWSRIAPWQRYELAAICGLEKFGSLKHAGTMYARAAWCARQEAVAEASTEADLSDPVSTMEYVDMFTARIKAQPDTAKQNEMKFQLARIYERAGMCLQRDEVIKGLDAKAPAEPSYARFKELIGIERKYLEEAAADYRKAIDSGEITGNDTGLYEYLIADFSRRMGKYSEAIGGYEKALKTEGLRPDVRELATFLLAAVKSKETPAQEK